MGIGTCDVRIQVAEFTVFSFCVARVDVACFRRMKGSDMTPTDKMPNIHGGNLLFAGDISGWFSKLNYKLNYAESWFLTWSIFTYLPTGCLAALQTARHVPRLGKTARL